MTKLGSTSLSKTVEFQGTTPTKESDFAKEAKPAGDTENESKLPQIPLWLRHLKKGDIPNTSSAGLSSQSPLCKNSLMLWMPVLTLTPLAKPVLKMTLKGHKDDVDSASFSPDGKMIVSASGDTTLRLWSAKTGEPIGEPMTGHEDWVYSASFSSDGTQVVSASCDKTVKIWQVAKFV